MSWTRGLLALLAVCVLLVTGSVSCGADGARKHKDGQSVSPVGKVLDDTDHEGRHYREVDQENAPDVGIVVQPDAADGWSVRLTVQNFAFSPATTKAKAVSGRGFAVLFVDDRPVTTLRTPSCRLPAAYVPQGTHKVTARLYADDGTVWAVDGTPVESTADVTASKPQAMGGAGSESGAMASVDAIPGSQLALGAGDGASPSQHTASASGRASRAQFTVRASGDVSGSRSVASSGGGVGAAQVGVHAGGSVPGARPSAGWHPAAQVDADAGATASGSRPAVRSGGDVTTPQVGMRVEGAALGSRLARGVGGDASTLRVGVRSGATALEAPLVSCTRSRPPTSQVVPRTGATAREARLVPRTRSHPPTSQVGTPTGVTVPQAHPVPCSGGSR
ncbi:hypothetical protein [Streptomyces sp. NPDC006335]|uniref:hypothetical protein n=1 Tax=Streptomyces sp. NPDC006335 TaxID=3156895 RepID=UPI0033BC699F